MNDFDVYFETQRLAQQDNDRNRLLNICSALGGMEELEDGSIAYVAGDEVIECLGDIKKLLRAEAEAALATTETPADLGVSAALGEWRIVGRDLLPLLRHANLRPITSNANTIATKKTQSADARRAMLIVELLVPLTWATADDEPRAAAAYSPAHHALLRHKDDFLDPAFFSQIMLLLLTRIAVPFRYIPFLLHIPLLRLIVRHPCSDRSPRDNARIRLIITLFRNLLAIRDSVSGSSDSYHTSSLQEKLLVCLHEASVTNLILTFAAQMDEKEFSVYNTLILEIVYLIFLDRTVSSILVDTQVQQAEKLIDLVNKEIKIKAARPLSSRHSRFGGTLALNLGNGKQANLFHTNTALHSVQTALDMGKTTGRAKQKGQKEAGTKTVIRDKQAQQVLREIADSFLENSFNALISSVKDDFDKEREHIQEGDYYRFLAVVSFFLEYQMEILKTFSDEQDREKFDFDTVADFISSRSIMFVVKRMQIYLEEKKWDELQICLQCLKNMLITLNAMASSGNEEYMDASHNIQNNLYYEAHVLDLVVQLCKGFKDQNFSYLKNLVETVHIFVKMLEKFSKSKAFMVVKRKKRQQRQKKNTSAEGDLIAEEVYVVVEEPEEDVYEIKRICVEHEFRFEKIENDFAFENVVSTYCELLKRYRDLEPKYLHYATTMLHRIFIKVKMEPMLYKLSTLELFNRIISDEMLMEPSKEYKELKDFIRYVVKKFVAKAKDYPLLFVEILFSKTRGDCRRIQYGADEDFDFNNSSLSKHSKDQEEEENELPRELEIQRDLTWNQKVGVIVSLLVHDSLIGLLDWLETTLTSVAVRRASDEEDPDAEIQNFDLTASAASNMDVTIALKRNNRFHLLLELMQLTKVIEGDSDIRWILEKSRSADDIISDCKFIRFYIEEPLDSNGKPLEKMIRMKAKKRVKKPKISDEEDEENNSNDEGKKPKKKKAEKPSPIYLSAQFVEDSDNDDDEAFFEAERRQRLKSEAAAIALESATSSTSTKNQKKSKLTTPKSVFSSKSKLNVLQEKNGMSKNTIESDLEGEITAPKQEVDGDSDSDVQASLDSQASSAHENRQIDKKRPAILNDSDSEDRDVGKSRRKSARSVAGRITNFGLSSSKREDLKAIMEIVNSPTTIGEVKTASCARKNTIFDSDSE
ncbi:Topoisomerase 1-associated factor 1 [Physocladia obscura]|uniref:Topoisomerase 1-associated factor 1 n=1 Tax=Physocladia obscura TaxID=109957 RepID=A0AAD5T291_9FUNG|nr:Topoisomerase 1-associated factor 1 [Physocladia obscura]